MIVSDLINDILSLLTVNSELEEATPKQMQIVRNAVNEEIDSLVENKNINFWRQQEETILFPSEALVYSESATYPVGSIVKRSSTDSTRYRNKTAVTTGESFDINKWSITNKTVTIPNDYYDVSDHVAVKIGDLDIRQLEYKNQEEYFDIINKEEVGIPMYYTPFCNIDFSVDLYLYPQPDSVGLDGYELTFRGILKHINYMSNTDTINESGSIINLIKYSVAKRVMMHFGITVNSDIGQSILFFEKESKNLLNTRNDIKYTSKIINPAIGF